MGSVADKIVKGMASALGSKVVDMAGLADDSRRGRSLQAPGAARPGRGAAAVPFGPSIGRMIGGGDRRGLGRGRPASGGMDQDRERETDRSVNGK